MLRFVIFHVALIYFAGCSSSRPESIAIDDAHNVQVAENPIPYSIAATDVLAINTAGHIFTVPKSLNANSVNAVHVIFASKHTSEESYYYSTAWDGQDGIRLSSANLHAVSGPSIFSRFPARARLLVGSRIRR